MWDFLWGADWGTKLTILAFIGLLIKGLFGFLAGNKNTPPKS